MQLKLKSHFEPHTVIISDFDTPLSPIDRLSIQKLIREMLELNNVINQMDLPHTYRKFYTNTNEYTFFSEEHITFSKTDHIS